MTDHFPQLCDDCGAPLPARRSCLKCHHRASAASRRSAGQVHDDARHRREPLVEAMEMLQPWIRGERGLWRR